MGYFRVFVPTYPTGAVSNAPYCPGHVPEHPNPSVQSKDLPAVLAPTTSPSRTNDSLDAQIGAVESS